MIPALTDCSVCKKPFTSDDLPPPPDHIVFTTCFHTFHITCLSGWVNTAEKDCPNCKATIYKHQSGKTFEAYRTIFLEALSKDPDLVRTVMEQSDHKNSICTACCLEELPTSTLRYANRAFIHSKCATGNPPPLLMEHFAKIVIALAQKHPYLKQKLTPTPPNWLQRFFINHPFASKAALTLSISLAALMLNQHTFSGKNGPLSVAGLPAYLMVQVARRVCLLILFLLNSPLLSK